MNSRTNVNAAAGLLDAFARLHAFCGRHGLGVPDLIEFWRKTFTDAPRVGLFATAGADAAELLRALSGAEATREDLRGWICEAGPPRSGRELLLSDGSTLPAPDGAASEAGAGAAHKPAVLALRGERLGGALVSAAPYRVVRKNPSALTPEDWLERIALVVVVTPAEAAVGKPEVELMRLLAGQGRAFVLVVAGPGGVEPSERDALAREIDEFKLAPLKREMGNFPTLYADPDSEHAELKRALGEWVALRGESEQAAQLVRVVSPWLASARQLIDDRVAAERAQAERMTYVLTHARAQHGYLSDLVPHEGLAVQNRLHAELTALVEECERAGALFARWVREPAGDWCGTLAGLWEAWGRFAERVSAAPADLVAAVNAKHEDLAREFTGAYAEYLRGATARPLAVSFPDYVRAVGPDLRRAEAEFREPAERLAGRYAALLRRPKEDSGEPPDSPDTPESDREPSRGVRDAAERVAVRLDPDRVERELREGLTALAERTARPLLLRAADQLTRHVLPRLRAEHLKALEGFMAGVGAEIEAARRGHVWAARRAEFNELRERWESLTLPHARRR